MGLLDWQPSTESLFPDYSCAAFGSVNVQHKVSIQLHAKRTPSYAVSASLLAVPQPLTVDSVTSSTSSSSSSSSASSASGSIKKNSTSTSLTMLLADSRPVGSTGMPLPRRRKRAATFDFYGADEELQSAESKIAYCEKCRKHCDVHCAT